MLFRLRKELKRYAHPEKAKSLQRFFKTDKGEYGEGDVFLGISVPLSRKIAREFSELEMKDIKKLLFSQIHEERLISLLILIEKYKKSDLRMKEEIFNFYVKNATQVNNWDLVDLSAPNIIGNFLKNRNKEILYKFANSDSLWKKRIGIVSTFEFIRNNNFSDCLKISKILLKNNHDLIHKAVGWMLREVGKRDVKILEEFLRKNYNDIPRTTLRYAIERFYEEKRKGWLKGEF